MANCWTEIDGITLNWTSIKLANWRQHVKAIFLAYRERALAGALVRGMGGPLIAYDTYLKPILDALPLMTLDNFCTCNIAGYHGVPRYMYTVLSQGVPLLPLYSNTIRGVANYNPAAELQLGYDAYGAWSPYKLFSYTDGRPSSTSYFTTELFTYIKPQEDAYPSPVGFYDKTSGALPYLYYEGRDTFEQWLLQMYSILRCMTGLYTVWRRNSSIPHGPTYEFGPLLVTSSNYPNWTATITVQYQGSQNDSAIATIESTLGYSIGTMSAHADYLLYIFHGKKVSDLVISDLRGTTTVTADNYSIYATGEREVLLVKPDFTFDSMTY
jgi:hypothetical protein